MRETVDLPRLKRAVPTIACPYCKSQVSQVSATQNALVWYCASCDVYHQTTPRGVSLGSYRKEAENIINLPPQES